MKKNISFLMVVISVVICMLPSAKAAEYEEKDGFIYIKGTNIITRYVGTSSEVRIPDNTKLDFNFDLANRRKTEDNGWQIDDFVRKLTIGNNVQYDGRTLSMAVNQYSNIEEIIFEEGISYIPDYTGQGWSTIKNISFPDTLESIGAYAFSDYENDNKGAPQIESLYIPNSVLKIGERAFKGCEELKELHLSEKLQTMGENAFMRVNTNSVNLPINLNTGEVTAVVQAKEYIFGDMTAKIYKALWFTDWIKEKYLKGLTGKNMGEYEDFIILDNVLCKYIGADPNPIIPQEVKEICPGAFERCNIKTVVLPEDIKEIPLRCFYESKLEEIKIPESVETIGAASFVGTKIKKLTIPKSVKNIATTFAERCIELEEVTFEGAPKMGVFFQDSYKLKKENVHFLDSSIVVPDEFWGFLEIDSILTIIPTQKPDSTASPTQSPKPTAAPTTAPTATPTAVPTATPTPEEKHIDVSSKGGDVELVINSRAVHFPDAKPFIDESDRTQIPIRVLSELLGFEVKWEEESHTAVLTRENTVITVKIGDKHITKNGNPIEMDTEAKIIGDRTYIPLRFIAEALGCTVEWK